MDVGFPFGFPLGAEAQKKAPKGLQNIFEVVGPQNPGVLFEAD